jgi:hypothetical protein
MRRDILIGGAVVLVAGLIALRYAGNHRGITASDLQRASLPPGYTATHGAIALDSAHGAIHIDKLALFRNGQPLFTADDATLSGLGPLDKDDVPTRLGHLTAHGASFLTYRRIDRIELDGVALHNLRAMFDPASYPNGKPVNADRMKLLESGDIYGAVARVEPPPPKNGGHPVPPFDITAQHAHAAGISARLLSSPPSPDTLNDRAAAADLLRAIAEDSGSIEGMSAQIPQGGSFTIGSEAVQGYDGGRMQSVDVEAIGWTGGTIPGSVSLQKFEMKNLDVTRLLDRLPAILADPKNSGAQLGNSVRYDGIDIRGFKADFPAAPLVTLDSIAGTNTYSGNGAITGEGTLTGLAIVTTGRPLKPDTQLALQQFGMADFTMDAAGKSSLDPATGHITGDVTEKFHDLGSLRISADLDGVPLNQSDPAHVTDAFRDTRLIKADLRWDDASLTGRLFKVAAAKSGKSEQELRATISLSLLGVAAMLPDQPDAADQINAFLDGRHTLEIILAPPAPVRLGALASVPVPEKAHVLGVKIKGS